MKGVDVDKNKNIKIKIEKKEVIFVERRGLIW